MSEKATLTTLDSEITDFFEVLDFREEVCRELSPDGNYFPIPTTEYESLILDFLQSKGVDLRTFSKPIGDELEQRVSEEDIALSQGILKLGKKIAAIYCETSDDYKLEEGKTAMKMLREVSQKGKVIYKFLDNILETFKPFEAEEVYKESGLRDRVSTLISDDCNQHFMPFFFISSLSSINLTYQKATHTMEEDKATTIHKEVVYKVLKYLEGNLTSGDQLSFAYKSRDKVSEKVNQIINKCYGFSNEDDVSSSSVTLDRATFEEYALRESVSQGKKLVTPYEQFANKFGPITGASYTGSRETGQRKITIHIDRGNGIDEQTQFDYSHKSPNENTRYGIISMIEEALHSNHVNPTLMKSTTSALGNIRKHI